MIQTSPLVGPMRSFPIAEKRSAVSASIASFNQVDELWVPAPIESMGLVYLPTFG